MKSNKNTIYILDDADIKQAIIDYITKESKEELIKDSVDVEYDVQRTQVKDTEFVSLSATVKVWT